MTGFSFFRHRFRDLVVSVWFVVVSGKQSTADLHYLAVYLDTEWDHCIVLVFILPKIPQSTAHSMTASTSRYPNWLRVFQKMWEQHTLMRTLYLCVHICPGSSHWFDYTTRASFSRAFCTNPLRWNSQLILNAQCSLCMNCKQCRSEFCCSIIK